MNIKFTGIEIKNCIEQLNDLIRDGQSFLIGEEDHDEVFIADIYYLQMAVSILKELE